MKSKQSCSFSMNVKSAKPWTIAKICSHLRASNRYPIKAIVTHR